MNCDYRCVFVGKVSSSIEFCYIAFLCPKKYIWTFVFSARFLFLWKVMFLLDISLLCIILISICSHVRLCTVYSWTLWCMFKPLDVVAQRIAFFFTVISWDWSSFQKNIYIVIGIKLQIEVSKLFCHVFYFNYFLKTERLSKLSSYMSPLELSTSIVVEILHIFSFSE